MPALLCGGGGGIFDDAEGGFEEGHPVGDDAVHFVLKDIGEEDEVLFLEGGLQFGELAAELDERFAWEIFLIRDRTINAFALPGGYFGVHLGLIGTVGSSDELAAVRGPEYRERRVRFDAQVHVRSMWLRPTPPSSLPAAPSATGACLLRRGSYPGE